MPHLTNAHHPNYDNSPTEPIPFEDIEAEQITEPVFASDLGHAALADQVEAASSDHDREAAVEAFGRTPEGRDISGYRRHLINIRAAVEEARYRDLRDAAHMNNYLETNGIRTIDLRFITNSQTVDARIKQIDDISARLGDRLDALSSIAENLAIDYPHIRNGASVNVRQSRKSGETEGKLESDWIVVKVQANGSITVIKEDENGLRRKSVPAGDLFKENPVQPKPEAAPKPKSLANEVSKFISTLDGGRLYEGQAYLKSALRNQPKGSPEARAIATELERSKHLIRELAQRPDLRHGSMVNVPIIHRQGNHPNQPRYIRLEVGAITENGHFIMIDRHGRTTRMTAEDVLKHNPKH